MPCLFLKKLDFKRLNYVYIFFGKIFAGFSENAANFVVVSTGVRGTPVLKALRISAVSQ